MRHEGGKYEVYFRIRSSRATAIKYRVVPFGPFLVPFGPRGFPTSARTVVLETPSTFAALRGSTRRACRRPDFARVVGGAAGGRARSFGGRGGRTSPGGFCGCFGRPPGGGAGVFLGC